MEFHEKNERFFALTVLKWLEVITILQSWKACYVGIPSLSNRVNGHIF